MPDHYAHYRFGKDVLPSLPQEARQCVQRFRRMYDMGLQGPDIFYYCNPFLKNQAGALGQAFHLQSGREFFAAASDAADSEAARAYLYGLLGHYCLDSRCHPYVNQLVDIGEARHVALEKEFDRALLARDGVAEPGFYDISPRLKLTRGECVSVARLYPGATGAMVSRSVRGMAWISRFLASRKRARREKLVKTFCPGFLDHFIPLAEAEEYTLYVGELGERYGQAKDTYPRMLEALLAHMTEEAPLGAEFDPIFG